MTGIEWKDTTVIRLRSCRFVKESGDRFAVVRRAGKSRVIMRAAGLAACELFRGGCAIGSAKQRVAERFQVEPERVDLSPLLQSLTNAGLIASVDGKRVPEPSKPSPASAWRYFLRFHVSPRLLRLSYRKLPPAIGRRLAYWTWRVDAKAALWPQALRAAEQFAGCPADARPQLSSRQFARLYFHHLVQNFVDFESVMEMAPAQAEAWFRNHVDYEGLEHLASLKSEGVPLIIAGFHFSTVKLIGLLLTRCGYDVNHFWLQDRSMEGESVKRLEEFRRLNPGFGRLGSIPGFSMEHYRRLIQSVRAGQVVIWFSDIFPGRDGLDPEKLTWRDKATKAFRIAEFRTELPQSKIEVELLGQQVYLSAWIGAFARITGAAVVPGALVRERGRLKMIFRPALRLPQHCGQKQVEALNRAMFRELEALVRLYPDQWYGWAGLSQAA